MTKRPTNIKFPCEFPLKIMGLADSHFESTVLKILRKHIPHLSEGAINPRYSTKGKYLSMTVTITATSKHMLDAIYQDLSDEKLVLMTL